MNHEPLRTGGDCPTAPGSEARGSSTFRALAWVLGTSIILGGCTCGGGQEEAPGGDEVHAEEPAAAASAGTEEAGAVEPFCEVEPQTDAAVYGEERGGMFGRFASHARRPVALLCQGECTPEQVASLAPDRACTGVMVATNILLTARSCLTDSPTPDHAGLRSAALERKAVFGFAANAEGEAPDPAALDIRRVVELVESGKTDTVDYALLRVADDPGVRWGQVRLHRPNERGEAMARQVGNVPTKRLIHHHRAGKPIQVAMGAFETDGVFEKLSVPTDVSSRGAVVWDIRTRQVAGILVEPGDCAAGIPATVMTTSALLDGSRTLPGLVTVYGSGNRTSLASISFTCGSRSCSIGPGTCDGKPCCDENRDGVADDPPLCWDTIEHGCSVDCPRGKPVAWSCKTGGALDDRTVEYAKDGDGEKLAEDCGDECSGTTTPDGGLEVRCHYLD